MSILQTRTLGEKQEFVFNAQKGFLATLYAIKTHNSRDKAITSDIIDYNNFKLLKKQLGMERQELMLKQLMTKNNDVNLQNGNPNPNANNIGNNFNKQKFELVEKYNDGSIRLDANFNLALFDAENKVPTGLPYDIIFEKIKKVLPFLSNLFMELIEDKYPTGTSVQVAEYQNLQQRLDYAQLTGQLQKEAKNIKKVKK